MNSSIALDTIRMHLPHIDIDNLGSRPVPLHSLFDENGQWHMWLQTGEDTLTEMGGIVVEGCYFAKFPANPHDVHNKFIEFLDQRAGIHEIQYLSRAAFSDMQNIATSFAKLELAFNNREKYPGTHRMAATELEYIFIVCRSLLDIMQETIALLWERVQLNDSSLKKRDLPRSFTKMVMRDGVCLTADEIADKYQIPSALAIVYHETGPYFNWLKQYRDYITHSGKSFDRVLIVENGFAIRSKEKPFSEMGIWVASNTGANHLGSLKSAACYVVNSTINVINEIITRLDSAVTFPPPIAPNYKIFICGENIEYLHRVSRGIKEDPWF